MSTRSPQETEIPPELFIRVLPASEGGSIGLYHLSQGLVDLQRTLNRIASSNSPTLGEALTLSVSQRREIFRLLVREVNQGSVDIVAVLNDPYVRGLMWFAGNTAVQVFSGVLTAMILNASKVNAGENPFGPDDPDRRGLQTLAGTASAGDLIFELRLGNYSVRIDRHTAHRFKELMGGDHYGTEIRDQGIVVGSSMERTYIDISLDSYNRNPIRCTYDRGRAGLFEPYTRLGTHVAITGYPVWRGSPAYTGYPSVVELRGIIEIPEPHPNPW